MLVIGANVTVTQNGRLEFSMGQTYGFDCTLSMCAKTYSA